MSDETDTRPCEIPVGMEARLTAAFETLEDTLGKNETPAVAGFVLFMAPCKTHGIALGIEQWINEGLEPDDVVEIRARIEEYLVDLNKAYPPA